MADPTPPTRTDRRQTMVAAALKAAGGAGAVAMFTLWRRVLGEDAFGSLAVAFSFATPLAIVGVGGMNSAALKFVAVRWDSHRGRANALASAALVRSTVFTLLLGGALAACALLFGAAVTAPPVVAVLLAVPLAAAEVRMAIGRAVGQVVLALGPRDVVWRALLMGMAGIALVIDWRPGYFTVFAAAAASLAVLISAQGLLQPGSLLKRPAPGPDIDAMRAVGLRIWPSTALFAIGEYMDTVAVGAFVSVEEAGSYFLASRLAIVMALPLVALNQVIEPKAAQEIAAGRESDFSADLRPLMRLTVASTGALVCLVVSVGWVAFGIAGVDRSDAMAILAVLACGNFVNTATGPGIAVLQMSGHELVGTKISAASQGTFLALLPLVAAGFGPLGVAVLKAGEVVVRNAALAVAAERRTGIVVRVTYR